MTVEQTSHATWMALPEVDRTAWNNFRRAAVGVIAQADADLQEHVQLGYVDLDALISLSIATDRTMRMAELARAVSRSPSALTRLVCRLEDRGLVERTRRSATEVSVTVTAAGLALLDEAVPRHLALIDQLFWSPLTPRQRATLGDLAGRLLDVDAPDC
jgi:MarR family 2-MHQ and catechol resistance regulon transcriptional repressor